MISIVKTSRLKIFKAKSIFTLLIYSILIALFVPLALGDESADKKRAEEISARMAKEFEAKCESRTSILQFNQILLQELVNALSEEEIRLLGHYQPVSLFNYCVFRRWSAFDHVAAFRELKNLENEYAAEIKLAGTGLEGGPGDATLDYVGGLYLGAAEGWSTVEPKQAWEEFKNRKGVFARSPIVEEYVGSFYKCIFTHLAKIEPDAVFEEIVALQNVEYEDLIKEGMLIGYLQGAPKGRNWGKEADRLLDIKWKKKPAWQFYYAIQTAFMGRWLQDTPSAAEKWFQEGKVEDLHWHMDPQFSYSDSFNLLATDNTKNVMKQMRVATLGGAAGYWAGKDFAAAWSWMKTYKNLQRINFAGDMLDGVSAFFGEENINEVARGHCLEQLAKLPNQADRDQFASLFATVLWVFDPTEFLSEPAPDKQQWLKNTEKDMVKRHLSPEVVQRIITALKEKKNDSGFSE